MLLENSTRWKNTKIMHPHVKSFRHFASTMWCHQSLKGVARWFLFLCFWHLVTPLSNLHIPAKYEYNLGHCFVLYNFTIPLGDFFYLIAIGT